LNWLISQLKRHGLTVAPEKIQQSAPWKYLGWLITDAQIHPQKITLHNNISTLHDAQKLFGDLQWVCTIVGITNDDLQPFLSWLHGSDVSEKLQHGWSARRVEHLPLSLFLSNAEACPLAIVFQWKKEKGGEPIQLECHVMSRTDAFAALIRKGRDRIVEIDGKEPVDISVPMKDEDLEWLLRHSVALQEALLGFAGVVHNKQPKGPMWHLIKRHRWLERPLCSMKPVEGRTVFTDAVYVWQQQGKWLQHLIKGEAGDSLQTLELKAVCWALQTWNKEPLNVISDSLYVVGVVQRIEDALIRKTQNQCLGELFLQLWSVLKQCQHVFCVTHIQSHQCNSGLGEGNAQADAAVSCVVH
ncbi:hypothetical protein HGM15179_022373, partial [Zosterops borbonicus]